MRDEGGMAYYAGVYAVEDDEEENDGESIYRLICDCIESVCAVYSSSE